MKGEPVVNVNVRIPERIHDRIVRSADRDRRSRNSQILWLVERGLEADEKEQQPEQPKR